MSCTAHAFCAILFNDSNTTWTAYHIQCDYRTGWRKIYLKTMHNRSTYMFISNTKWHRKFAAQHKKTHKHSLTHTHTCSEKHKHTFKLYQNTNPLCNKCVRFSVYTEYFPFFAAAGADAGRHRHSLLTSVHRSLKSFHVVVFSSPAKNYVFHLNIELYALLTVNIRIWCHKTINK